MKIAFKPEYSNLFQKIKQIDMPVKNDILMSLLDGKWHTESEILKITRQKCKYMGSITLTSMIDSLNGHAENEYLEKKNVNGRMFYKISDNYVALTRSAFMNFKFKEY
jgi:hypothetical protein